MTAVYVATIVGIIVAAIYIWSVVRGLKRARQEMAVYGGAQLGQIEAVKDGVYEAQEAGLGWKTATGLVLSVIALALIVTSPVLWYIVPFLSIATAIAVIVAFAIEERSGKARDTAQ